MAFVDVCEKGESVALRQRQWDELQGLVDWTRRNCKKYSSPEEGQRNG